MKTAEIQKIAQNMGIKAVSKVTKKKLINEIQLKEGNTPCFDTGMTNCGEYGCAWRDDCIK